MSAESDPFDEYVVVIASDGAHSIWPTCRDVPAGWDPTEIKGSREACLEAIEARWVDMRPLAAVT